MPGLRGLLPSGPRAAASTQCQMYHFHELMQPQAQAGCMAWKGEFGLDITPIEPTHPGASVRHLLVSDTLFNLTSCFSLTSTLLPGPMPYSPPLFKTPPVPCLHIRYIIASTRVL